MANPNPSPATRFKKGDPPANPGGRPKGSVGLNNRIRKLLLSEENGVVVADALVKELVKAALRNPAKMWPFLKEFMDRDEGRTDGRNESEDAKTPEQVAQEVRDALDAMKAATAVKPPARKKRVTKKKVAKKKATRKKATRKKAATRKKTTKSKPKQ